ncbi:MAG: hypothetical protein CXT78_06685 [Thaumarchaeota archaeon]|nr:MAG: hypothetical protein CXT78_06685 [Nitrososphaerota archaeon]
MIILGLNHGEINSSAVLLKNGKILAGAPEERFIRIKKTKSFPKNSIEFCLSEADIKLKECDYVAQAWNPGEYWRKFNPLLSGNRIKREDYLYTVRDNLYNFTERKIPSWTFLDSEGDEMPPIYFVRHHLTHAANAFFLSPFDESAILTCDHRGEFETTTFGLGKNLDIEIFSKQTMPHSLGLFYAAFTELLGYRADNDEWRVMALSAFDVDYTEQLEKIRNTIKLKENGLFELDQSYYNGGTLTEPKLFTQKLVHLLGDRIGKKNENPTDWHFAIAKAMQTVSEEIIFHILKHLHNVTKIDNLVLGGGFFMNSVCNGKITEKTPFKNVYISYAPADVGNSIGAALYVAHCIHREKRNYSFKSSNLGPTFTDQEIHEVLERRKIICEKIDNPEQKIASLLESGHIVAVFNGKMEFGERALGNRSILGDPRKHDIKDKINSIIKYRESYRPFAPAVLSEKAHLIFDVPEGFDCNYMEKVMFVKNDFREKLPAITHVDGSGRLQTVQKEHNSFFYKIIEEFEKITDIPVVLDTSFNINGEPIVLSPDDALNTFFNSGLEFLMMNSFLVKK